MNSTKDDKPLEDGLKIINEKDEDSEKDVDGKKSNFTGHTWFLSPVWVAVCL